MKSMWLFLMLFFVFYRNEFCSLFGTVVFCCLFGTVVFLHMIIINCVMNCVSKVFSQSSQIFSRGNWNKNNKGQKLIYYKYFFTNWPSTLKLIFVSVSLVRKKSERIERKFKHKIRACVMNYVTVMVWWSIKWQQIVITRLRNLILLWIVITGLVP